MFNNEIFDSWLDKKSDEILSKVDKETITTEEMIILVLKAQTNHFHHMDLDMKSGLGKLNLQNEEFKIQFKEIQEQFKEVDQRFKEVDQRFRELDQKIDNRFMWMIGITIAMSGGIYLKLFFG